MASDKVKSLAEVRARIDALDAELLALVDERAALAREVAQAKREAGETGFGLRPAREAALLRGLLARSRAAADAPLVVRLWREIMSASLASQGPFSLGVFGGRDVPYAVELARARFGSAPGLTRLESPEEALRFAKRDGGVAVLSLLSDTPWWGRMLLSPELKVFAALPCLSYWGRPLALGVAKIELEPTGADQTFFVTDTPGSWSEVLQTLSKNGVAGEPLAEAKGLRLLSLGGYYQPDDPRLAALPGTLNGVIGAAPLPLDQ